MNDLVPLALSYLSHTESDVGGLLSPAAHVLQRMFALTCAFRGILLPVLGGFLQNTLTVPEGLDAHAEQESRAAASSHLHEEHVSAHHMPGRTLPGRLGLGQWELWGSSPASCSRVVAMVHGVVNEQLSRFAEQHVQDRHGENVFE